MSDKISNERLIEIMERRSPSLRWGEAEKVAKELLERRAAEVKPVKLPSSTFVHDEEDYGAGGCWMVPVSLVTKAIKAAGGTVEGDNG